MYFVVNMMHIGVSLISSVYVYKSFLDIDQSIFQNKVIESIIFENKNYP